MDIGQPALPNCYEVPQVVNPKTKISTFSDETLFYIFYTMPRDELQDLAAAELYVAIFVF
jgi:CCR4-NOT transcription complex subunit 2